MPAAGKKVGQEVGIAIGQEVRQEIGHEVGHEDRPRVMQQVIQAGVKNTEDASSTEACDKPLSEQLAKQSRKHSGNWQEIFDFRILS